MSHSFLPPSGAAAWLRCALWPTMNQRFPQDDSPESIEGSAAHWVVWNQPREGTITPYGGLPVTDEMIQGAELFWDAVRMRLGQNRETLIKQAHIEEQIPIADVSRDCFGTPDLWIFNKDSMVLHIFDYKFGHGFVDEFWNEQTLLYFFGILKIIEKKILGDWRKLTVCVTIVQPRCFHKGEPVRTHKFIAADAYLRLDQFKKAAMNADITLGPPQAVTGEHCEYCPGRHSCDALQKAAYSAAEVATASLPHTLTPQAAALELRMLQPKLERLQARVEGLSELTLNNLKRGISLPYYHTESTKPREQWTIPVDEVILLGEGLDCKIEKPSVLTPKQAIKAGMDAEIVKAFTMNPPGSLKLVADNPNDVRKVFGE